MDLLLERQLITLDDAVTFKEVCPLFDPCFASYDEPLSHYEQLHQAAWKALDSCVPLSIFAPKEGVSGIFLYSSFLTFFACFEDLKMSDDNVGMCESIGK